MSEKAVSGAQSALETQIQFLLGAAERSSHRPSIWQLSPPTLHNPPSERSHSGLVRRTRNAVWGNSPWVRIPPSPPPPGRRVFLTLYSKHFARARIFLGGGWGRHVTTP